MTRVSAIRSDTLTPETAESSVQSLHLTLRCKGVRFDGVRTEREQEKLRRYAEPLSLSTGGYRSRQLRPPGCG